MEVGIKPLGIARAQLINARIPTDYWECDFVNYFGPEEPKNITKLYLKTLDKMQDKGIGLLYVGPTGVGKTTLATIALKYLVRAGWSCYMTTLSELIEDIKRSWQADNPIEIDHITFCKEVDFLLIDDVGKEHQGPTGFGQTTFDNLIRYRTQNRKPTILTSNLNRKEIKNKYSDALLSLVEGKCRVITVNGKDTRKEVLKPELQKTL